ncbi:MULTISPECIES: hypothetical protein [unclassified Microcoleus]|uniref:hypothetical protein n=1 Tax=unclassified Microcoleus TaxID=2642155 RepID=UPI002FD47FDD
MPVPQENLSFVEQAEKPVADNGARYQIDRTALEVSVKNLVSGCALLSGFSFLTFRDIVVNLFHHF